MNNELTMLPRHIVGWGKAGGGYSSWLLAPRSAHPPKVWQPLTPLVLVFAGIPSLYTVPYDGEASPQSATVRNRHNSVAGNRFV